jgi:hypothetical protein
MDYREVWDEGNFKFSSDTRRLNHVSWDNYKREKKQNKLIYRLARIIKNEYETILFLLSCGIVLFGTILLFN